MQRSRTVDQINGPLAAAEHRDEALRRVDDDDGRFNRKIAGSAALNKPRRTLELAKKAIEAARRVPHGSVHG
jgi:hypothetical protein